jgi:hypothetical protein
VAARRLSELLLRRGQLGGELCCLRESPHRLSAAALLDVFLAAPDFGHGVQLDSGHAKVIVHCEDPALYERGA